MKKTKFLIFSLSILANISTILGLSNKTMIKSNAEEYLPAYVSGFTPHTNNGNVFFNVKDLSGNALTPITGEMTYLINGELYSSGGINTNGTSPYIKGSKSIMDKDASVGKTTSYTFLEGQTFKTSDKSYKLMFTQTAIATKINCEPYYDGQYQYDYKYITVQQPTVNPSDDELENYDIFSINDLPISINGELNVANLAANSQYSISLSPSEKNITKSFEFRFKLKVSQDRVNSQTCFKLKQGATGTEQILFHGNWVLPIWSEGAIEQRYHSPNTGGGVYPYSTTNGEWVNFQIRSICLKDSDIYLNQVRINDNTTSISFINDKEFANATGFIIYRTSDCTDLLLKDWDYETINKNNYVDIQGDQLMLLTMDDKAGAFTYDDYGLFRNKYDIQNASIGFDNNEVNVIRKLSFPSINADRYTYMHIIMNNGTWAVQCGYKECDEEGAILFPNPNSTFGFEILDDDGNLIYRHEHEVGLYGFNDVSRHTIPLLPFANENNIVNHINIRRIGYTGAIHIGNIRFDNIGLIEETTPIEKVNNPILNLIDKESFKQLDQTSPQYVLLDKEDKNIEGLYISNSNEINDDINNGFSEFKFNVPSELLYESISFTYKYIDANNSNCVSVDNLDIAYQMKSYIEINNSDENSINISKEQYNNNLFINDGKYHDVIINLNQNEIENIIFKIYHFQGELIISNISLPHKHIFIDIFSETKATCTDDGLLTYICPCGELHNEIIPSTGHNYIFIEKVEATESSNGYLEHYICENCNKVFIKDGDNYIETTLDNLLIEYVIDSISSDTSIEDKPNKGCSASINIVSKLIIILSILGIFIILKKQERIS